MDYRYDLNTIKDRYGEKMMQFCRSNFSSILCTEGLLPFILKNNFGETKQLFKDIVEQNKQADFIKYIMKQNKIQSPAPNTLNKNPFELMSDAGYNLFECKTEKDVWVFEKYYRPAELICTYIDINNRLESHNVFFAVKKDIENIIRPEDIQSRDDIYGTSCISLQFLKYYDDFTTLSIKNRYNHHVENPDATFDNNLDNIIPGLTRSFEDYLGKSLTSRIEDLQLANNDQANQFTLDNYIATSDNKLYRCNYKISGIYYLTNNKICGKGYTVPFLKDHTIVMDYFIFKKRKVDNFSFSTFDTVIKDGLCSLIAGVKSCTESVFVDSKKRKCKKFEIIDYADFKTTLIVNDLNQIISFENNEIKNIPNNFMQYNTTLESIVAKSVTTICSGFLLSNTNKNINLEFDSLIAFDNSNNIISKKLNEIVNKNIIKEEEKKKNFGDNNFYPSF